MKNFSVSGFEVLQVAEVIRSGRAAVDEEIRTADESFALSKNLSATIFFSVDKKF